MNRLRFGILSTAGIGKKNWKAIYHSGNCTVAAVASRDLSKGQRFVADCQQEAKFSIEPRVYGSYEELIHSPEVDAVYIPLPTGLRAAWVEKAAAAGKHVVCEKPCAIDAAQLERMIAKCRQHKVQFMDGVMFMHSPRLPKIREVLDDGVRVGRIRRITSSFSFYVGEEFFRNNIRVDGRLEPTGCLGDLGWYSIRFTLWALNWQMPLEVSAKILAQSDASGDQLPAPTEFTTELTFAGGVTAGFYCSFHAARQQWMIVGGQKGYLTMPDFVRPLNSYAPAFNVNDEWTRVVMPGTCPPGVDPGLQGHPYSQDTMMFQNFARQVATGKLEEKWPEWSLQTQRVQDACFASAKLGRPVFPGA